MKKKTKTICHTLICSNIITNKEIDRILKIVLSHQNIQIMNVFKPFIAENITVKHG